MKPFDLQKALNGAPVITRTGCKVLSLLDEGDILRVIIKENISLTNWNTTFWTHQNGKHGPENILTRFDLFMAEEESPPIDPTTLPTGILPVEETTNSNPYAVTFHGHKLDIYRVIDLYCITDAAHQHALKKLIRAGKTHKTFKQDIKEVIQSLHRLLEMKEEDGK